MRHLGFSVGLMSVVLLLVSGCASNNVKTQVVDTNLSKPSIERPILSPQLEADYALALGLLRDGELSEAKTKFTRLLAAEPRLAGAHVNLGIIAQKGNDIGEAKEQFEKALALNPSNADALAALGAAALKRGEFRQAESLLLQAVDNNPRLALAHYNLGVLYELYLKDKSDAVEHYERYVALSPNEDTKTVERWIKLLER